MLLGVLCSNSSDFPSKFFNNRLITPINIELYSVCNTTIIDLLYQNLKAKKNIILGFCLLFISNVSVAQHFILTTWLEFSGRVLVEQLVLIKIDRLFSTFINGVHKSSFRRAAIKQNVAINESEILLSRCRCSTAVKYYSACIDDI